LDIILTELAVKRPVFQNEMDFQFELAWKIKTEFPNWNIRFEKPLTDSENEMRKIDLWIEGDNTYAVELKYPTRTLFHEVNNEIDITAYANYLGVKDRNRKTILYAPTWKWGAGTLHQYGYRFCQEFTKEYNLIIRPHYFDRKYILKFKLWAKSKGLKHIYFSNPANILSNDTMFDFALSNLLISDTSSILYEYLITRNPIIIANTQHVDLHNMPPEMDISTIAYHMGGKDNIIKVVESVFAHHDSNNFEKMLHHCFYFNDGKSIERISKFLSSTSLEIINYFYNIFLSQ
jgi:CDP-glycerol glycerophosphotransferase (TagB/SpsB family)